MALAALIAMTAGAPGSAPGQPPPTRGDCAVGPATSRCLYRSSFPSTGLVVECRSDAACRVGYYYGDPEGATWFPPPSTWSTFPRPTVRWWTATLAEARFDCGAACSVSYFFEAKRRRLSPPRANSIAVEARRLLVAQPDGSALVVRQVFGGREVLRIEREWAPGLDPAGAITAVRFDPDGRLAFTWLRGPQREPVSERVSVPSIPR